MRFTKASTSAAGPFLVAPTCAYPHRNRSSRSRASRPENSPRNRNTVTEPAVTTHSIRFHQSIPRAPELEKYSVSAQRPIVTTEIVMGTVSQRCPRASQWIAPGTHSIVRPDQDAQRSRMNGRNSPTIRPPPAIGLLSTNGPANRARLSRVDQRLRPSAPLPAVSRILIGNRCETPIAPDAKLTPANASQSVCRSQGCLATASSMPTAFAWPLLFHDNTCFPCSLSLDLLTSHLPFMPLISPSRFHSPVSSLRAASVSVDKIANPCRRPATAPWLEPVLNEYPLSFGARRRRNSDNDHSRRVVAGTETSDCLASRSPRRRSRHQRRPIVRS